MRHTNRHARAQRRAAGWGTSAAVLSAALLVVGLAGGASPADAAPEDAASTAQQENESQTPAAQQETVSQEQSGEHAVASSEGDGDRRATESEPAQVEDLGATDETGGDDAAVSARATDESAAEAAEPPTEADPVLSTLTVQVTDMSGTAVPGVGFELWQEANDDAGLQSSGDTDTDAGCTTTADGSCTAGANAAGAPQLTAGTYYWVQTETPDGYQAPAEADEPVGTVTVTDAEAGTDLDPTEVTLAAAEEAAEVTESGSTDNEIGAAPGSAAARSADNGVMAPMSVPSPSARAGTAVINVNVGGLRAGTGSNAVSDLAGVTLRLHHAVDEGSLWFEDWQRGGLVDESWGTCVSDADGDCSFVVPDTSGSGANRDARFFIVQESAPAGWYANTDLVVGQNNHSASDYKFLTGSRLRAGQTYQSGTDFMASSGNQTSSGLWQNSMNNPTLPQTCTAGLNVALVLDLSGSMDPYLNNLKSSATGFVNALAGTGSSVALFTFAENAPRTTGSSGRNYPLMAIDSGNNQQTITDRINAYSSGGGTNWDSGLYQVAESGTDFDLAVVVTDGNATFYRNGSSVGGNGSTTRFAESEYAIFSANAIKAEDTRVLAVGVGDGISGSAANLAAISGPTPYTSGAAAKDVDYFQSSWQQLASLLSEIAKGATCQATVDVTKYTQTYGSTAWVPTEGWAFDASQQTGASAFSSIGDGVTGSDGTVEFSVQFDTMDATTSVRLTEQPSAAQQDLGWELVADQVQCSVNGAPVDLTVDSAGLSLTVADIGVNDHVSCDFYNRQVLEPGIQVIKTAYDSASHEQEIAPGSPVLSGTTVYWTYEVTNTGETPLHGVTVQDDQVGAASCPSDTLAIGASMICTASGPVTALATTP